MSDGITDALERVADAICDGRPVDWEHVGVENQALEGRLEQLRSLETIANVHRASQPDMTLDATAMSTTQSTAPELGIGAATSVPLAGVVGPTWGSLRILESIGRGGFGEVYRAFDPALRREVALKLLQSHHGADARATERLLEEARRLASIRHPNVLVVHGVAEHDGRAGIWTDFVHGKTLTQLVAEQGPLGAHEATLVGIELCRALAALHVAGLVHRDVKPANVMREQGGRIVLMDFGSVVEGVKDAQLPRESPRPEGTPLLMAPELLLQGATPGPTSDVYSLGVLLYWLVSGRYPIESNDLGEIRDKHRRRQSVPLRDVRADLPTPFVRIVERALDSEPARRYTGAGLMERDLAAALGASPSVEPATTQPPEAAPRTRRRRHAAIAAVLAVVVIAAIALAPVVAPRPLRIDAALYRQGQGVEERLLPGSTIRSGDRLFLEVLGSRRMHVYVLDEDAQGEIFVLFPPAPEVVESALQGPLESGPRNPLPARVRHRLPRLGASALAYWEVTGSGGPETILVLAATDPRPELDRELQPLPRPAPGSKRKSRGLPRVVEGETSRGRQLEDLARRSAELGFLVWKIQVQTASEPGTPPEK